MERAIHRREDEQVHHRNREQEERGHARADEPTDVVPRCEIGAQRSRRRRDRHRREDDDGRMAERKEQARRHRTLPILHQLSRDVVDRRDVVRVDGVSQAEAVRQQRRTQQQRIVTKGHERPRPGAEVGGDERGEQHDDAPSS